MSLITWQTAYEVGVVEIDEQHKRLVALINELHEKKTSSEKDQIIRDALIEVVNYTRTHFTDEEQLMEKALYPKLIEHKELHKRFVNQIILLLHELKANNRMVIDDILDILRNWFIMHILVHDRQVAEYLNNKNEG